MIPALVTHLISKPALKGLWDWPMARTPPPHSRRALIPEAVKKGNYPHRSRLLVAMTGRPHWGLGAAICCFMVACVVIAVPRSTVMAQEHSDTTYVTRDTLVPSLYQIHHKPLQAGIEGGYGWGWQWNANLNATPAALTGCDHYATGTGNGFSIRAIAEMPMWGDASPWEFEPSFFFELQRPDFRWDQALFTRDTNNGSLDPFTIRHEVQTTVDQIGIGGTFTYELVPNFFLEAGANLGLLFLQDYQASLHRVEPGALLPDGTRDTTIGTGKLSKKLDLVPAVSLEMSYEAPISKTLRVRPGISASIPFGGYAAATPSWLGSMSFWNTIEVNASISILLDLTPRTETVPVYVKQEIQVPVAPAPPVPKSTLTASIKAMAMSSTGQESNVVQMTVEEVRTRNADPILNYIFFDPGSATFPQRYITYSTPEDARRLFQGSTERNGVSLMTLYRETLNILGDRLRKYPSTILTLIGSTDNCDDRTQNAKPDRTQKELLSLARARAEAVRNYLVHIWQIDPKRLKIETTLLPAKPSPSTTEEGRAENRRVEFRIETGNTDAFRVMDPIIVTNIEHLATPDRIVLIPTVSSSHIARTFASISAGGVELQTFNGTANSEQAEKVWAPTESTLKKLRDSLDIDYDVWDSSGNHAHAHSSIPLDIIHIQSNRPERIERFSLILFGFDEAALNPNNERSIRSAANMIPTIPIQRVLIQGYTDETGNAEHNDELSSERANAVKERLEAMLHSEGATVPTEIHTEGHGSRDLLYDNTLPEGRFFSRTVNITIEREP